MADIGTPEALLEAHAAAIMKFGERLPGVGRRVASGVP
jgi:hypothetical protein